ncbi:MAG: hydroxymethylglutaryl-CoA reductase, degradative, partial [Candidatus Margulisiibacteriota bacterium]
SNDANHRRSHARVSIPIEALDQPSQSGKEIAVKIVQASRFAFLNSQRAVTSNKGVDNAVMALALAMGQDIRATSAALHYYAQN